MINLSIGCGNEYKEGYKNIDISHEVRADEYYDIQQGIQELDNSCEVVEAGCVLEQIETNKLFIFVMNEIWRVLDTNGKLTGYVPSTDQNVLFVDPMDKRFFSLDSFKYFDIDEHCYRMFGKTYGFKPWRIISLEKKENGIIHFVMSPVK